MTRTIQNKRLLLIMLAVALLLAVPLVGMLVSDEVNWSVFDFVLAAGLLSGTGLVIEVALRRFKNLRQRIIICALVLTVLLLVWIELAVGIFGSPIAGN